MLKKGCLLFTGLLFIFFASLAQSECNLGTDTNGDGLPDCSGDPECQFAGEEKGCNCVDGSDNDGDGKIDIDDSDCADYFGLTFVGEGTDCSIAPPPGTPFFDFEDPIGVSGQNTVDTQSKMAIGDVDGDGIPDIMTTTKWNTALRLIHTVNSPEYNLDPGDDKAIFNIDNYATPQIANNSHLFPELEVLIADLEGDGTAEVFATISERSANGKDVKAYFLLGLDYVKGTDPSDGSFQLLWSDIVKVGDETMRPGIMGIADFDGDGKGELYLKDRIYAAETGALIASGNGGSWLTAVNSAPVAANIVGDNTLELISGNIIYSVNAGNLASRTMQTLTVVEDMNDLVIPEKYFPKKFTDLFEYGSANFSSTSVADLNKDGSLDVVMSGAVNGNSGSTAIFLWNVKDQKVGVFKPSHPDVLVEKNDTLSKATTVSFPKGWVWGTGRVNLGDIDGDGILEASFIAGNQLWALEADGATATLTEKWRRTINDSRSGVVTTTVYDFDNDGQPELVYRDSQELSIIDGLTGTDTKRSVPCKSHTMTEGPIIADVNGDGATDICVPCFRGPGNFKIDDQNQEKLGEIRLFNSTPASAWLPTRQVWNQPGYFVVNINDDLTLPFPQLDQTMNFGDADCANGLPGPQWPFNVFLNQVPSISANGCPIYPAPDISFAGIDPRDPAYDPTLGPGDPGYIPPTIEVIPPVCGDTEIQITFNITNDGSRIITDDIPVTFWDVDPTVSPVDSNRLDWFIGGVKQEVLPVTNFQIGEIITFTNITVQSYGRAFTLYIVLNDETYADPVAPIVLEATTECKVDNNIYDFPIVPQPFVVEVNTKDNNKCDDTFDDDGWLDAVVFEGGSETTNYDNFFFQWYYGRDTTNPIPSPEGSGKGDEGGKLLDKLPGLAGVPEGEYTVVVTNIELGCSSEPLDTLIARTKFPPVVSINVLQHQSICAPENGKLEGIVEGGNAGYKFRWYDVSLGLTFIADDITTIGSLGKGSYQLSVDREDGCGETFSDPVTILGPEFPDIQTFELRDITNCEIDDAGVVSAKAFFNDVEQDSTDYSFEWRFSDATFRTDSTLLFPQNTEPEDVLLAYPTRKKLEAGIYAVRATSNATQCASAWNFAQVENLTNIPELTLSEVEPQTSCDPANPNGKIRVDITINTIPQDPSLFTIEWFRGDNTLDANKITTTSGTNGEVAEGIGAGGIPYTAKVTSANDCFDTDKLTISETLIIPTITATPFDNSICDPALAGTGFNGKIETVVTYDGNTVTDFTDFTFTWYEGTDVINDPPIPGETGPILDQIDGGTYSVTVTRNGLNCTSPPATPIVVNDIPDLPVILISDTPETTCAGAGTPNGQLAAAVDVVGTPTIAGYTYEWYVGTDITDPSKRLATVSGTEDEEAINLDGDLTYTVRVINDATGCENDRAFYLDDVSARPIVTLTKTDNLVCDSNIGFTGTVTAAITDLNGSLDFANDYTFTWYQGATPTPGNEVADPDPSTPLTLEGRDGNFYTLVVTNDVTECNSVAVAIEVKDIPPVINIVITENTTSTTCSGTPNGILAAAVDPGTGNTTIGYTFEWYEDLDTDPVTGTRTNTDGNDYRAIELQGGIGQQFTVKVIEDATGCENELIVDLNDASQIPIVVLTPANNTICDPVVAGIPYNGTVTAVVTDVNGAALGHNFASDYTFDWTDGLGNPVVDGDPLTPLVLDQVPGDDYTLTLTNDILGCISIPVTVTVDDTPAAFTIVVDKTPSTNCPGGAPNGTVTAGVDAGGLNGIYDAGEEDLASYDYEWYEDIDTDPLTGTPTATGATVNIATLLQGGIGEQFTVKVIDRSTGCTKDLTIDLDDASQIPIVVLTPANNTICDPVVAGIPYNGTVTAVVTDVNGAALGHNFASDYTFDWTDDLGNPVVDGDPLTPLVLDQVPGDDYTLTLTNDILGCISIPVTVTVDDTPAAFTIVVDKTPSTNCPGGAPNGTVTAGVDAGGLNGIYDAGEEDLASYDYEWYEDIDTDPLTGTPTATGATVNIATLLQGGIGEQFTVKVIDRSTGCTKDLTIDLDDASQIPIVVLTPANNTICDPVVAGIPYNGTVTAVVTDVNGAALGHNFASDYTFDWTDDLGNPVVDGDPLTPLVLDQVPGDDYTLTLTNDILGCISIPVTVTVDDTPAAFTIVVDKTPSTNCPGGAPNGTVTAGVDAGGLNGIYDAGEEDLASYDYEWYEDIDTDPLTGTPTATGATVNIATLLQGGIGEQFTVKVIDRSTGCTKDLTIDLDDASQIPIVVLTPANNTICDPVVAGIPYNGTVTAVVTDVNGAALGHNFASDYTFDWTDGLGNPVVDGDPLTPLVLDQVPGDDYTLTLTNDILGCISIPVTVTVDDTPAAFTIVVDKTPSTNCPGGAPNGTVTAGVDAGGLNGIYDAGEEDLASYDYEWYEDIDTDPLTGTPTATGATVNIATLLQGGIGEQFTVKVIDRSTGCTKDLTIDLDDASQIPIVVLTPANNTICDPVVAGIPYNGTVTAVVTDVNGAALGHNFASDYTFDWTDDLGNPVVDGDPLTPLVLDQVPGDDYTLTLTNDILGCISIPVTVTVDDTPAAFTIVVDKTPSTNCPGGAPNGTVTAGVDAGGLNGIYDAGEEDLASYDYEWYEDIDTDPLTGTPTATGATVNIATLLQGGIGEQFTVKVIDRSTGCTKDLTIDLDDASQIPIVVLTPANNTICDPVVAGIPYNGTVTAVVTDVNGAALGHNFASDYTFDWTDGLGNPVVDGDPLTPLVLDQVPGDDYTLTLTNDILGCISIPVTVTVDDTPAAFTIVVDKTPSTNCPGGAPNGTVTAGVDAGGLNGIYDAGEEDLASYDYEWYEDIDTDPLTGTPTATGATVNIATLLQGGIGEQFTVKVIDRSTGCTKDLTIDLDHSPILPTVVLSETDNTICTPPVGGSFDGTVTAVVNDVNGAALGHNFATDYTFAWTDALSNPVADGDPLTPLVLDDVQDGDYTLTLTNDITGCTALPVTITVGFSPEPIDIFFTNVLNTSCSATGNGSLLAGIDLDHDGPETAPGPGDEDDLANLGDYDMVWYIGSMPPGSAVENLVAENNINEVQGNAFYTVEVTRISTGCTNSLTEWVQKVITIPDITVTATDYTDCNTDVFVDVVINNLAAFAPDNHPIADFNYTWFRGSDSGTGTPLPTAGIALNGTSDGAIMTTLDGATELWADDYTVIVQHFNSTCTATEETDRVDEPPIRFNIIPNHISAATNCGVMNGIAYVTIGDSGFGLPPGPLTYTWYKGAPTNTAPVKSFSYVGPGSVYNQTDNVDSASFFTDPVVTFGAAVVEMSPGDDQGLGLGTDPVLSGVEDGLYTVVVEDANGCMEYITFQVPFATAQQSNIVTVTPDTDCTADNSSINVLVVPNVADADNTVPEDFKVYLFAGSSPTLPVPPANPNPADYVEVQQGKNLVGGGNTFPTVAGTMAPGVYSIVSQGDNGVSRCFSVPTIVTIEEWAHDPIVNLFGTINPNTSCDIPATPDGNLTLDIKHNPDEQWDLAALPVPIPEPTYTMTAVPTVGGFATIGPLPVDLLVPANNVIAGLGPITYDITVTSSRGCSTTRTFTVPDEPVVTEVTSFTLEHTYTCSPLGGSMEVTAINRVGQVGALDRDDFTFNWYYDANNNGILDDVIVYTEVGEDNDANPDKGEKFDVNDAGFAGPGTYWVEVVADPAAGVGLNCPSAPFQFIMNDFRVNPSYAYDVTANTSCVGGPDGSLYIDPDRNGAALPDYPAFTQWTIDFTTDPSGLLGMGNTLGAEDDIFTAQGLVDGTYVFDIRDDATGCTITGSLEIVNSPVASVLRNTGYSVVDQFLCGPDGSVTITEIETVVSGIANAGPPPSVTQPSTTTDLTMSNYTFTWYRGSVAPANIVFGPQAGGIDPLVDGNFLNANTYVPLAPGDEMGADTYFVTFQKTSANPGEGGVGCDASQVEFLIIDQSIDPTFVYDVTANTSCAGGPDGSLYIDPDRNGAALPNYPAFTQWTIDFTTDPSGLLGLGNTMGGVDDVFTAQGLVDGTYNFTVTDDATGCSRTGSLIIANNPVASVLNNTGYSITDQFVCGPDGSITITEIETVVSGIANAGPPPSVTQPSTTTDLTMSNYTFTWYRGSVAPANIVFGPQAGGIDPLVDGNFLNANTYVPLAPGDEMGADTYFVTFQKTSANPGEGGVGCDASQVEFLIIDQSIDPTFVYDVTANTSCAGNPDGSFYIDPDRNGAVLPNYPAFTQWTIDFTTDPSGLLGLGNTMGGVDDVFTAQGLVDGTYNFTITDDATGCFRTGSLEIANNPVASVLNNTGYSITDQFVCGPDGSITITEIETVVSGIANAGPPPSVTQPSTTTDLTMSNYTFTWYRGSVAPANIVFGPLVGGVDPLVDGNFLNPNTYVPLAPGDEMRADTYFVTFQKTATNAGQGGLNCNSSQVEFLIIDQSIDPTFVYDVTANTSCSLGPDGSLYIDPDRNGAALPDYPAFTQWTIDFTTDPSGLLGMGNVMGGVDDIFTAQGLVDGTYNFTITDDATGCFRTGSLEIANNPVASVLNNTGYSITDQFVCGPDGSITITEIETVVSGIANAGPPPSVTQPSTTTDLTMSNYTFTWYRGSVAPANIVFGPQAGGIDPLVDGNFLNPNTYVPLAPGDEMRADTYFVTFQKTATNAGQGGLNCNSSQVEFLIIDQSVDPTFLYEVTANTSCAGNPDGSFYIDPDRNGAVLPNYPAFTQWTIDFTTDPSGLLGLGNTMGGVDDVFTAQGLVDGTYNFTITDDATGCFRTGSLEIANNPVASVLNNTGYSITDQFVCGPDGSITITEIETVVSGIANAGPPPSVTQPSTTTDLTMSNYTFTWYRGSVAPANIVFGPLVGGVDPLVDGNFLNPNTYVPLAPGDEMRADTYFVTFQKTATNAGQGGLNCNSSQVEFLIIDQSIDPTFVYDVTANTSCSLGPDGSLYIDPDRNGAALPDYPAFTQWTIDFTTDPSGLLGMGNVMGGVDDIFTAQGLVDGTYNFTITDDATGCFRTGSLEIANNPVASVLNNTGYSITDQFVCGPDGSITITEIETVVSGIANAGPPPSVTQPSTTTDLTMSNYTFTWYRGSVAPANIVFGPLVGGVDPLVDGNFLNPNTYVPLAPGDEMRADTYFVTFQKTATNAGQGGLNCNSSQVEFLIIDQSIDPTFVYDVTANTSCSLGPDGSLYIDPDRNGAALPDYSAFTQWTIDFTTDPSGLLGMGNVMGGVDDIFTAQGLVDGTYNFTITDDATGCSRTGSLVIANNPVAPVIDNIGYSVVHQLVCNPDGSVEINGIETIVSGLPGPPIVPPSMTIDNIMSNYTFTWYKDDVNPANIVFGPQVGGVDPLVDGNYLNVNTYVPLGAGDAMGAATYFVTFEKSSTNAGQGGLGCESAPLSFRIDDLSVDPVITFAQISNTACDLTQADGEITAFATTSSIAVPAGSIFTWHVGTDVSAPLFQDGIDGTLDQSVVGQEKLLNVAPGIYTVTVEDANTGCSFTASYEVEDQPAIPNLILDNATVTDQDICLPSGSITIAETDIDFGTNPIDIEDFIFTWTREDPNGTPLDSVDTGLPIQGPMIYASIYNNMGAGSYYVNITPKSGVGAGCPGPPIKLVVNDVSTDPIIAFETTSNSSCDIANPNGEVVATIVEVDGTGADPYTYVWEFNGGATLPTGAVQTDVDSTSTISGALDGIYTVNITNDATGCTTSSSIEVIIDQTVSEPNIIAVDKTDPLDCNPSGRMEVVEIQVGGLPADVNDFEYEWYAGDVNPSNQIMDFNGDPIFTPNLEFLIPGKYYVIARDLITRCESIAKEVNILPDDIIFPTIGIELGRPQTSCDLLNPNGQLIATVDGNNDDTNTDYVFTWYNGFDTTGSQIASGSTLSDVGAGGYTIEILNTVTGCASTASYFVEDKTEDFRLQVAGDANPVTFCNFDNGVIEARIINHSNGNFQFDWTGPNGFTARGQRIENVAPGTYNVVATDLDADYCTSLVVSTVVEDQRTPPVIEISMDSPLTNCYIDDPNGQLTALADDGQVVGYDFVWYNGSDITGNPADSANIYSGLTSGTFTVQVTNQLTQCADQQSEEVLDATVTPPNPNATILNHLTNCIDPDGEIEADVGGNQIDYIFDWYDGDAVGSTVDNRGANYNHLDLGDYTVTAKDIVTGCISEGVTRRILDQRILPQFTFKTKPANCNESNGFAEIVFADSYEINQVVWSDDLGNIVDLNTNLYDYPSGTYDVLVTTFSGCTNVGTAVIGPEITNYNGISANNDGSNDGFQIDCIELFPNNNVKIFNRAGVLIYEEDGYDNANVVFTGLGLNGVYLVGQEVPDGTYFYVIDKGDGSRPVTGYLELIR